MINNERDGFVKPITVLLNSLMKPFTDGGVRRPYIPDYPLGAWRSLFLFAAEAKPLAEELQKINDGRRRGPQLRGDILPIVLARLGVGAIQSAESGE